MASLADQGCEAELLDLAEFPAELHLAMDYRGRERSFRLRRKDGGELDLNGVTAVWWRRPQAFVLPPDLTDAAARRYAISESTTVFQGLYQSLDARWVNDPARDACAGHKPYQLTLAQQIGLDIAPTLITNDPEAAREFWRAHPGEVIHKQLIALPDTWRETRRLKDEDESLADAIVYAPVQFQRHVPAMLDLRVIIVGNRIFAAGTDVSAGDYPQDVRMNVDARYAAHELPRDLQEKIHALMRRLGLVYGALDFRLTPEGRYVFLEINPAGQFLYIENDTGQPIAAALAQELAKTAD